MPNSLPNCRPSGRRMGTTVNAAETMDDERTPSTCAANPARIHCRDSGKHDFMTLTCGVERSPSRSLQYIRMNPVKRKLLAHPKDWPWSNFFILCEKGLHFYPLRSCELILIPSPNPRPSKTTRPGHPKFKIKGQATRPVQCKNQASDVQHFASPRQRPDPFTVMSNVAALCKRCHHKNQGKTDRSRHVPMVQWKGPCGYTGT